MVKGLNDVNIETLSLSKSYFSLSSNQYINSDWSVSSYLTEVNKYKSLWWQLMWKDVKVRYASTKLGVLWAIINPVLTLFIMVFVFHYMLQTKVSLHSEMAITIIGIAVWNFFSGFLSETSNSLITNQAIIKKIYFPKLILPLSKIGIASIDFLVAFILTIIIFIIEGVSFSTNIVYLPFILILLIFISIGFAILINAMIIQFRDIIHIVPFMLRIGIFITPVAYAADIVSPKYKVLFFCNPITGVVELFRWSLIKEYPFPPLWYLSTSVGVFILILGFLYFIKIEREIVDRL